MHMCPHLRARTQKKKDKKGLVTNFMLDLRVNPNILSTTSLLKDYKQQHAPLYISQLSSHQIEYWFTEKLLILVLWVNINTLVQHIHVHACVSLCLEYFLQKNQIIIWFYQAYK